MSEAEFILEAMRQDCNSPEHRDFVKSQLSKLVSIYRQSKPGARQVLEHCGTGFLLTYQERYYLVSAAHVFDDTAEFDLGIYKKIDGNLRSYVFNGIKHTTSLPASGSRDDDFIDIGFMELDQGGIAFLGQENFFTFDDFEVGHHCKVSSLYVAVGYPNKQNAPNKHKEVLRRQPVSYTMNGGTEDRFTAFKTARREHVILDFDKQRVNICGGGVQSPIGPRGMSGGPIFRYKDFLSELPQKPKIVAISIENPSFGKSSVLIGTSVSFLFSAIHTANSRDRADVAPSIS